MALTESGVSINGASVALDDVAMLAFAYTRAENPTLTAHDVLLKAPIYVRADQTIAYGHVVDVMDRLQRGGFQKVGVFAELAEN